MLSQGDLGHVGIGCGGPKAAGRLCQLSHMEGAADGDALAGDLPQVQRDDVSRRRAKHLHGQSLLLPWWDTLDSCS